MNEVLKAALLYRGHGYSIIPTKPDKKPYIPWTPYQSQKAEPTTIEQWWKEWPEANIGIVTGKISGIVVVDVDNEAGREALDKYIPDSLLVPSSNTPRGGVHLYFKHPGSPVGNATGILPGVDVRGNGGYVIAPPGKGANGKAYSWIDGLSIFDIPPAEMPDEFLSKLSIHFKQIKQVGLFLSNSLADLSNWFTEGHRDNTLFHIAIALLKGSMPESEVEVVLRQLALSCTPPYNPPQLKEIKIKIKSAIKHISNKDRNISYEVRLWVLEAPGTFATTQLDRELELNTRELSQIRAVTLNTLCKERLIEKVGEKRGYYRRMDEELRKINIISTKDVELKLYWPFQIERYFRVLPKNIIIIAGGVDAGKTAFLLNLLKLNQDNHKMHYFTSEMGDLELRDRLLKFDVPIESWKFDIWERSAFFHDVIRPDDINVIDFLEIHDEFYKVGGMIKQIYDKLNKGIAVIAIQKNPGRDEGLGGMRSLEKARLYLAMETGRLKIVKCKNWVNTSFNPNRLELDFKLVNGCKFVEATEWRKGV